MNLSKLNLNLLVALDALITEGHVTAAGNRLGLSQSAMSNALKQLREIYQDELLLRGQGSRMQLTDLAKALQEPVKLALQQVEIAFSGYNEFNPMTATRTFHVGMSDYISFVMLPSLIKALQKKAPNIRLVIHHINYLHSLDQFAQQPLDIIIGHFPHAPASLMSQRLFTDQGVCVMDKKHSLLKKKNINLKMLAQYHHIMVSYVDNPQDTFLDHIFRKNGLHVQTRFVVPHAYMALYAIPNTELVTHTVKRIAQPLLKQLNLAMIDSPFPCPDYIAYQYWQARHNDEPGHSWFRRLIKEVVSQ